MGEERRDKLRTSRYEPQLRSLPSHALEFIIHECVSLYLGRGFVFSVVKEHLCVCMCVCVCLCL